MGNLLDKINANLTNAGRTMSQKMKNSSDASKLMSEISAENKTIQENLLAIGRKYYDAFKDLPDAEFMDLIENVIKSEQRIAELQDSIKIIRSRTPELVPIPTPVACPECGHTCPAGSSFCPVCGCQLPSENISAEDHSSEKESGMVCESCGKTYNSGTAFCAVCGSKLIPKDISFENSDTEKKPSRTCKHCGRTYPDDSVYCVVCGTPLNDEEKTIKDDSNACETEMCTTHSTPTKENTTTCTYM